MLRSLIVDSRAQAGPLAMGIDVREADSFPEQWEYVTSDAPMTAVCCSRQCGKTWGARLRARRRATMRPGSKILYITLIKKNCRKLFFRPIQDELRKAGWSFEANEVDLLLRLPNGSTIEAIGCDDNAGLGKIRGDNYDLVIIDEAQEPASDVLERLIEQVLGPQFVSRGGDMDILGTPPESLSGYFMDALESPRWRFLNWSMFDAARGGKQDTAKILKAIEDRGLTPDSPVYQREYMGNHRVIDMTKLAYEYRPDTNDYDPASVDFTGPQWRHSMGLDLGFQDRDAIVIVAWRRDDAKRTAYVRHTWQENHLDVDQLAAVVRVVVDTYKPSIIVGDHGGHGAVKVLKTLEARLHLSIQAKPTDVMVSVGLVNDDLRTGRLLLPRGSELGSDLGRVQRTVNATTKRIEINKRGYHSDLSEALRYAHTGAWHWNAKAPAPPKTLDQLRYERMAARRAAELNPWAMRRGA